MKTKMLTRDEERELIQQWQRHGDERAMQRIIESHVPVARKMVRKFKKYHLPGVDLVQEGVIGLIEALKNFDESVGVRFNTFARWYVYSAMQEYVLKNFAVVKQGTSTKTRNAFFKGDRRAHVSLDILLPSGDTWANVLECEGDTPEQIVERLVDDERRWNSIRRELNKLPPRSRDIIRRRFLNKDIESLESISRRHGISRERVRQIEQKSLAMLKSALAGRDAA